MKLTIKWLKEWVDTQLSDDQLANKLTMAGLEVDALLPICGQFSGVLVGKIMTCLPHPNADKLQLCQVDIGDDNPKQIICGANNAQANLMVAVATIGASLPGLNIKKAKLRGIESHGMLCSAQELGINQDLFNSDGILELDQSLILGTDLHQALCLDDKILELDITPNRGDCFSVKGVAREIATIENLPLLAINPNVEQTIDDKKTINLLAPSACPRYLSRVIKGIDNTISTPNWMAEKLIYAGQKCHSLIVDVTNFVLLELGQPLHAFDLDKISGNIEVRFSQDRENIELLNEQSLTLKTNTLVIADEQSVLAMAGIMGGLKSSTTKTTTNILLESAFFTPIAIAGKARDYGLHTESSLRFERGVDFANQTLAIQRASQLIIDLAGGQAGQIVQAISVDDFPTLPQIHLRKQMLTKVLGFDLKTQWVKQQFENLSFKIDKIKADDFWITPPSFRFDVRIERDLIEELARLYGYDKLPSQVLSSKTQAYVNQQLPTNNLTQLLIARGYNEAICYSFISPTWHRRLSADKDPLTLKNPISEQMSVMRSSLIAGLLQTMINNQHYGHRNGRFFETGLCFEGLSSDEQIDKIAGVITGNRFEAQWSEPNRLVDFYDIKAEVELLLSLSGLDYEFQVTTQTILHPKKGADVLLNGKKIGYVGALSPIIESELSLTDVFIFELDLLPLKHIKTLSYQAFSDKQTTNRDISILLDETISFTQIKHSILAIGQAWLIDLVLFDVYTGKPIENGQKSLSLTLTYQTDKTLTDQEIDNQVNQVIKMLVKTYQAVQR